NEMKEYCNSQLKNNQGDSFYTEMAMFICKKSTTLKR
ncbi:SAM-dependent methyltransferase, partial [Bacillus thuringiensis]|nr:SAM-dependent methyltransferase [Bacillus thuringiensis]